MSPWRSPTRGSRSTAKLTADRGRIVNRFFQRLFSPNSGGREQPSFVVFDLDYRNGRLFLILTNTGSEPALDVSVEFDRPLRGLGGTREFADLPIFRGLPVLRPGKEIRLFFDAGPAISSVGQFTATTRWSTPGGDCHATRFRHDTSVFRDWPEVVESTGHLGRFPDT